VRLSYTTLRPLVWHMSCGTPEAITEDTARMLLAPHIPPIMSSIEQYRVVASPPDPWVFFASPGDFGGVGVVSRLGRVVFAGGIVWSGAGDITFPSSGYRNAAELGSGCALSDRPSAGRFIPSPEMTDAADAALDVVWSTALPRALTRVHGITGSFALGYPRTVGSLNPETAEWIVMLESHILL
jgi:hypothetical protein